MDIEIASSGSYILPEFSLLLALGAFLLVSGFP